MASTFDQLKGAVGNDRIVVIATMIDSLSDAIRILQRESNLDEEIETLDLEELSEKYCVTVATLKKRIREAIGEGSVLKIGNRQVIRKRSFLKYLEELERREQTS